MLLLGGMWGCVALCRSARSCSVWGLRGSLPEAVWGPNGVLERKILHACFQLNEPLDLQCTCLEQVQPTYTPGRFSGLVRPAVQFWQPPIT